MSILATIRHYYPDWEAPEDTEGWVKILCPFHGETRPSASVSVEHESFKCFACDVKGDYLKIIQLQEGVSRAEARRRATELALGTGAEVSSGTRRKRGRRVFTGERLDSREDQDFGSGSGGRAFY